MCVPQNYTIKELSKEASDNLNLSSFNQAQAKSLKIGSYCVDPKSGYPAVVYKCSDSQPGKHGHGKRVIDLRLLHNNRSIKLSFKPKEIIKQPIINKIDYLVSYMDEDMNQIICYDENFEETFLSISNDIYNKKIFDKVKKCICCSEKENKDCYVTVLEAPKQSLKNEDDVEILQIIVDAKLVDPH